MRYLYGATDDKYVKDVKHKFKTEDPLNKFQFSVHNCLQGKVHFDKNDVPIIFKCSPDTLLNLAINIVDSIPLPSVYTWTSIDICRWIRKYGYPQYQNTLRENYINGRTLLLLDASALSTMNIKNFDHIRHIAYGIRCLFYFEMTKFLRSISLPYEYYYEVYKLFRVKNGTKYFDTRRSDFWRNMQLIREKSKNSTHWHIIDRWLARERDPEYPELFGEIKRFNLFKLKKSEPATSHMHEALYLRCKCMPPCECHWTEKDIHKPWRFYCLSPRAEEPSLDEPCTCIPPCTCHWSPKKFMAASVLTCLHNAFPQKYGVLRHYQSGARILRNSKVRNNIT